MAEILKLEKRAKALLRKTNCKCNNVGDMRLVTVLHGSLGCEDIINDHKLTRSLFSKGIEVEYDHYKCLLRRTSVLVGEVNFLDHSHKLIAHYDGQSIYCSGSDGKHTYPDREDFVAFLSKKDYQNMFRLSCLGLNYYYVTDSTGIGQLIDSHKPSELGYKTENISSLPLH